MATHLTAHAPSGHVHHALVLGLYVAGFVMQVVGAALIGGDIRDDRTEAARMLRELHPLEWGKVDRVVPALADHVAGHRGRRVAGALLIGVGAAVGLAANLASYYS